MKRPRIPRIAGSASGVRPFTGPGVGALALFLLSACSSTQVEPLKPAARALEHYEGAQGPSSQPMQEALWWAQLGTPALSRLVGMADVQGHEVRIAVERLRQARAGQTQTASRLWPSLGLSASASHERSGLPAAVKQGSPDTRAFRGALELGWEIDVFGAARAADDAAAEEAQAAAVGVQAARWLLRTELARLYFAWQGARLRLQTLERLLQTRIDTERLTASREAAGQASRFDLSRAAGETQALRAQLPPLRTQIRVSALQMAALAGLTPGQANALLEVDSPPGLPVAAALPVGQPAELLLRRPDLQVAERRWRAEAARLRAADADLWPRLFLAAVLGQQDLRLNGLDLSPSRFSNAALAFQLPLFNAGRLRAAIEAQDARQREAALRYERAVLQALQEVESGLEALAQERQRARSVEGALQQRLAALRQAQALHREGQIDLLQLLDVQRAALAAEIDAIDTQEQLALNTVQLFKALGGGWRIPVVGDPLENDHE